MIYFHKIYFIHLLVALIDNEILLIIFTHFVAINYL